MRGKSRKNKLKKFFKNLWNSPVFFMGLFGIAFIAGLILFIIGGKKKAEYAVEPNGLIAHWNEGVSEELAGAIEVGEGIVINPSLINFDEIDMPMGYVYIAYNDQGETLGKGYYYYSSKDKESRNFFAPGKVQIASEVVHGSSMEDGMLYTISYMDVGDEVWEVLYINDPETLEFIAISVDKGEETVLYTMKDENDESVYDRMGIGEAMKGLIGDVADN